MTSVASTIAAADISTKKQGGKRFAVSQVAFDKSATTTMGAGKVVSDSAAVAASLKFLNVVTEPGKGGIIHSSLLTIDKNHTGTQDYMLVLYNEEPTDYLDNASFEFPSVDLPNMVGVVFFNTDDAIAGTDAIAYRSTNFPIPFVCAAAETSLYGVLVLQDAVTMSGGEEFYLSLHIEQEG